MPAEFSAPAMLPWLRRMAGGSWLVFLPLVNFTSIDALQAQDLVVIQEVEQAEADDEFEDEDEGEPQAMQAAQFEIAAEAFDSWVFPNQMPGVRPQQRLENMLEVQIEHMTMLYQLSEAQQNKLRLAGHGDLKRFMDRVEHLRDKFERVRRDQNAFNQIWQDIQPIQQEIEKIYGPESLFQKSLPMVLDESQRAELEATERERRQYYYRASLELAIAQFGNIVPLTEDQRQRLVKLALERTAPPRSSNPYEHYVVLINLARLPKSEMRKILDATQYATLERYLQQARGVERFLIQNGVLEEPAADNEGEP